MTAVFTQIDLNHIIRVEPYKGRIIGIISILEGYYYSISTRHFRSINSKSIDDVTLSELSLLYNNSICNSTGIHGVCWEYFVYEAIISKNEYMIEVINNAINGINENERKGYEDIDVILWGGEKRNLNLTEISKCISDEEYLWGVNGGIEFGKNLKLIDETFRYRKKRKMLPLEFDDIWMTDMFVKKLGGNIWYAVSVKWNKSQLNLGLHNGLAIGIAFLDDIKNSEQSKVEFLYQGYPNIKAICNIPFVYNLGMYFTDTFRLMNNILRYLNINSETAILLNFPTVYERKLFDYLRNNRYCRCKDILYTLKEFYNIVTSSIAADSVFLTNREIYIPNNKKNITSNNIINNKVIIN